MPINPTFDMDQKVLWFSDALYLGEYVHSQGRRLRHGLGLMLY